MYMVGKNAKTMIGVLFSSSNRCIEREYRVTEFTVVDSTIKRERLSAQGYINYIYR